MTTSHVEKFAELVAKDPALLAKLGLDKVNADAATASASEAAFITNAVKEAKRLGFEFTEEELNAFMAAERTAAASGELSDTQLEAVAGGASYNKFPEVMLSFSFKEAAMEINKDARIGATQSLSTARKQQAQKTAQKLGQ